jgi:hypothetical protein
MLLFIAPVSAFNQTLTEDRNVNRLVRSCLSSSWASTVHMTWYGDTSGIHSFCGSRYAYTSCWKRRLLSCCLTNTTSWTRSSSLESSFGTTWRRTKTDRIKRRVSYIVSPNFRTNAVEHCSAVDWVLFRWTDLKGKFTAIYQQDPQNKLALHIHVTCATDSNSTSIVLIRSTCTRPILLVKRHC